MSNSIVKNSIYNVLYKSLNVLFPLITSVYVSRILLSDGVGAVAAAQNVVLYFTVIASLGIPTYGVKLIAQSQESRKQLSKAFSELFVINAISTLICIILFLSLIIGVNYFSGRRILYLVAGLTLFFNFFNIDWFYQGIEKYKYITLRSTVVKIISLVALFCFVGTHDDYIAYALLSSLALVGNYLWNMVYARKLVDFHIDNLNLRTHLKPVVMLLAASIAIEIYTLLDTTMLAIIYGDSVVGLYSTSTKVEKIVKNLIVAACAVLLPRLSLYYSRGEYDKFSHLASTGLNIILMLSLPAAIGLILFSPRLIVFLFGNEFAGAVSSSQILAASIVTVGLSNYIGYQILVTIDREKIVLVSTIVGAILNVGLNILLIVPLQHTGAALASAITETIVLLVQLYFVKRYTVVWFSIRSLVSISCCLFRHVAVCGCMRQFSRCRYRVHLGFLRWWSCSLFRYACVAEKQ